MHKHLTWVTEYTAAVLPRAIQGDSKHIADMDIISRQALLMEAGGMTCKAIVAGEMAEILGGLVHLAYHALSGIALQHEELIAQPASWKHDGFVISVMRLLSNKINSCGTGEPEDYADLYCNCVQLADSFLNADFDKAFAVVHSAYMASLTAEKTANKIIKAPDLTDCLFE